MRFANGADALRWLKTVDILDCGFWITEQKTWRGDSVNWTLENRRVDTGRLCGCFGFRMSALSAFTGLNVLARATWVVQYIFRRLNQREREEATKQHSKHFNFSAALSPLSSHSLRLALPLTKTIKHTCWNTVTV